MENKTENQKPSYVSVGDFLSNWLITWQDGSACLNSLGKSMVVFEQQMNYMSFAILDVQDLEYLGGD